MPFVKLGRTNLKVEKNGFGALPIQRVQNKDDAKKLLLSALDAGITYFDTARSYTDSEEKVGYAFEGRRQDIILATKTLAKDAKTFWSDLETSLKLLKTDYIDVYQLHNAAELYGPDGEDGLYKAMLTAKQQGKIRFIAITCHRLAVAEQVVESNLYDLLQYPFSYLASDREVELVKKSAENNIGFVCMKALSGGLIKDSRAAYAYLAQFENALPIWGVQSQAELDEFISYIDHPVRLNAELEQIIANDRNELSGSFCRACGYCMPCPAGIDIPTAARMELLTRRFVKGAFNNEKGVAMMNKIEDCTGCGQCINNCPYGLNTPEVLKDNLSSFREYLVEYNK